MPCSLLLLSPSVPETVLWSFLRVAADHRAVGLSSQDLDRMADCGSDAVMPVPCAISSLADLRYVDQAEHDDEGCESGRDDGAMLPQFGDSTMTGAETRQPTH